MKARYITADREYPGDLHLSHCVDRGQGYAQLWYQGEASTFHIELTKAGALALASELAELAAGL